MRKELIKKLLFTVFFAFVCSFMFGATAEAEDVATFRCGDNVTATLDDCGTLTVTGSGDMYDYTYCSFTGDYGEEVYKVVIGDGITRIGDYSFYDLNNLQSVTIGKNVKEIGRYAFCLCESPMFTTVTIPSNVQVIDDGAFMGCTSLTNVSFQPGLQKIGEYAFRECYRLQSVSLPNGINVVETYAFYDAAKYVTIPENVGIIKSCAFVDAQSATVYSKTVTLGNGCLGDAKIRCYRGSTAETYAKQNGCECSYIGVNSTLYFNANGGSCKTSSMAVTSEYYYANLPIPTRVGYMFAGWYTSPNGGSIVSNGDLITQTSNMTVYAHWTKVTVGKTSIKKLTNKSKRKAVIKAKQISGANGYEVQYSTKKSMKSAKVKRKTSTNITISSLKKNKTYYVRARAYKYDSAGQKVYGKWSAVKKVKIKK